MSIFEKINFALVTSNSLMDKVPNWSSYAAMEEAQFLDLINYSKELVATDGDHKITFLVVAQGVDEVEEQENNEKQKALEEAEEIKVQKELEEEKSAALRKRSKTILNSIYGV